MQGKWVQAAVWFARSSWLVAGACQPPADAKMGANVGANHEPSAVITSTPPNSSSGISSSTLGVTGEGSTAGARAETDTSGAVSQGAEQVLTLADTDPNNDGEVAPPTELPGCLKELERLGVQFVSADIPFSQKRSEVFTCGATQVVVYKGRSSSPKYNSAPQLTCRMALGLIRFEDIANELATEYFGSTVRRIEQGGTYSCRKMARFANLVSEHSYANAIDIRSVQLTNGRTISVKRHFGSIATGPTTQEASFMRALASRLYDEGVFSVVLTPFFDRLHHDHFHFDQARYRVDGTR